jgi:polysaccharide pyruvyl transferase WcaK-like protein
MGVDALLSGTIYSILNSHPNAEIILMDYGHKPMHFSVPSPTGEEHDVRLANIRFSWKAFLPNNIFTLVVLAAMIRLIPSAGIRKFLFGKNARLNELQTSYLVCSLAGGDSFSDIYGMRRFFYVTLPQILTVLVGRPLILLPQTLGPFKSAIARSVSAWIMRSAAAVYSRDRESLEIASELLANRTANLRFSHDMAFALRGRPRAESAWLDTRDTSRPLVGLNISGLLLRGGYTGANMFGLSSDYPSLMRALIPQLVSLGADVALVSHVKGRGAEGESDADASEKLFAELSGKCGSSLRVISPEYDHREIKDLIGRCDFFLGSRMHACIAALSQGVPAVGLAYSRKFLGVFETVGAEDLVINLRDFDEAGVLAKVAQLFADREKYAGQLRLRVTEARRNADDFFGNFESGPSRRAESAAVPA